ncbi:hypothetical protein L21SP5_00425 [Salinivirga cyanobacteriivorans]|uniref:Uncharacterized protein n=1 Tax=Salinivirga cyanobacteriivorans TaxID=1307839 RepID=A0A0S2HVP1_9BACT|nr:hypothetical protein [Salinivirga cyanobacteriivorans]ALO14104.1 hypothetical protein L21SP5_00425 [Salinivirga cyanobacteriivorans]
MQTIKTNKIKIEFFIDKILTDFSIFQITTSDFYIPFGSLILDETISGLKALSVVFEKGNSFFCLFKGNSIKTNLISSTIKQFDGGDKLSVEKIDSKEKLEAVPIHLVAQLLINSLSSPSNDLLAFNNIAGSLLCLNRSLFVTNRSGENEKIIKIPALKLRIDKELCLNIDVKTFSSLLIKKKLDIKKPLKDYPKYIISHSTQKLRRLLPDEKIDAASIFIEKQEPKKKTTIDFIDFSGKEKFEASKMGFLYSFFQDIQKKLSNYLDLSFIEVKPKESIRYEKRLNIDKNTKVNEAIKNTSFHIVDMVGEEDSEEFILEIKKSLTTFTEASRISIGKRLKDECFNLIVIHNSVYYEKYNLEDPYRKDKPEGIAYQHITIEDFKYSSRSIINNIIKELIIKSDLKERKIQIVDWEAYQFNGNWKFGIKKDDLFYFLEVNPNGEMKFSTLENNLFSSSSYTEYCDLFDNLQNERKELQIDGIVVSDKEEINVIQQTDYYTIPDFLSVGNTFKEATQQFTINKKEFLDLFDEFSNQYEHKELETINNEIKDVAFSTLDRKQILQLITHRTVRKEFNQFFYERTGNLLHYYFKDALTRYKLLDSNLDIKYFQEGEFGYYFVGTKGEGIQSNFPRASKIRKVIPYNSAPILFDKLLPTLNVDFVKHENITVIPFPFKYLREYVNQTHTA